MQKTADSLDKKINNILSGLDKQRLTEALKKMQHQIDSLKYYLSLTKSKEKSVEYLKVVVADIENMLRFDVNQNYKNVTEALEELARQQKEPNKEIPTSPKSSLARLGQLMARKAELIKEAQDRAKIIKKANNG
jgi:predicted RNA-binding protein with EMAP domain